MSRKPKASKETVLRFMQTLYPGYGELALASKSEPEVLMDATSEIASLRAVAERAEMLESMLLTHLDDRVGTVLEAFHYRRRRAEEERNDAT